MADQTVGAGPPAPSSRQPRQHRHRRRRRHHRDRHTASPSGNTHACRRSRLGLCLFALVVLAMIVAVVSSGSLRGSGDISADLGADHAPGWAAGGVRTGSGARMADKWLHRTAAPGGQRRDGGGHHGPAARAKAMDMEFTCECLEAVLMACLRLSV